MALQIQDKIVQTFAQPNISDSYGPYPSTSVADIAVTAAGVKCAGLTVGIKDATTGVVTEYWYQPVEGRLQLVEKGGVSGDFVTEQELQQGLSGKQDTISDLQQIRERANEGHTALQPKQSGQYTQGDIVIFDANGSLADSQKKTTDFATAAQGAKADTAVQQVMVDPATETGDAGTSASVTNTGTQTAPVLKFTIPRGENAYNPFKGTYLITDTLPTTGKAGDYIHVVDSATPPVTHVYTWNGTAFVDSGETVTMGDSQFANSTKPISQTNVVNDLITGGVGDPLSAEQGKEISKYKIGDLTHIQSAGAGWYKYDFRTGVTYIIKDLRTTGSNITLSHTNDQTVTNPQDVATLTLGGKINYTPTSDGVYLRYGGAVDLTIEVADTISLRLGKAEFDISGINTELVSTNSNVTTNKKDLDSLKARRFVSDSSGTSDYNFVEGNQYFITSMGANDVTLSFADSSGNVIQSMDTFYQNRSKIVTAPANATKIRYGGACNILVESVFPENDYSIEYKEYFNGYITTNLPIGQTVDIRQVSSDVGWRYIVVKVSKYDRIRIKASGGTAPKAWCFTDNDFKVVGSSMISSVDSTVTVSSDGYCIVNSNSDILVVRNTRRNFEQIDRQFNKVEFNYDAAGFAPYNFEQGKKYVLTRLDNTPLQVTYSIRVADNLNNDNPAYNSKTLYGFGSQHVFVADINARYIRFGSGTIFTVEEYDSYSRRVGDLEESISNYGERCASVDFDFDDTFIDCSEDLVGVTFGTTTIEQVYAKFDALVSSYPSYITKVDAASADEGNINYPTYANLDGSASGDYEATPTYKTYMYKLVDTNAKANHTLKKKKLFIVGGTHGNEYAAPFNCYLIAKNLCTCEIADYFRLRAAFDVYIIPCLNGYGLYHNIRFNANGVDLNRNFPIANWASATSITDKGDNPGDQFETQLVMALVNKYMPDILIDHHNYGVQDSQFYTDMSYRRFLPMTYKCLVDCCKAFVKRLPTQFGTSYKLFYNIDQSSPYGLQNSQLGFMTRWAYEIGLPFSATMEIGQTIAYSNGIYAGSSALSDSYSADAFAVGEFTLRNQLCRYGGFILGNSY